MFSIILSNRLKYLLEKMLKEYQCAAFTKIEIQLKVV